MAAASLMIRLCLVRVCTTVKETGYAEHSQFAQVPMSPRVRFASVCTALWSSSKSPAVICLAALLASHRFAALHLALACVYLEGGRIQIDNNLVENSATRVSARSTFEAADHVVVLELGEEVQAQVHEAHDRGGSQGRAQASTRASSSRSTS
jgi:hypothetical protein